VRFRLRKLETEEIRTEDVCLAYNCEDFESSVTSTTTMEDSTFSLHELRSLGSSRTALTTDSDIELTDTDGPDTQEPLYSISNLLDSLWDFARKVDLYQFMMMFSNITAELGPKAYNFFCSETLGQCPSCKETHKFEAKRRCIKCRVQLYQVN
jgi:hypothetical protein